MAEVIPIRIPVECFLNADFYAAEARAQLYTLEEALQEQLENHLANLEFYAPHTMINV